MLCLAVQMALQYIYFGPYTGIATLAAILTAGFYALYAKIGRAHV